MASTVAQAPTPADVERLTSLGESFRIWQMRAAGKSIFKMPSYLWDDAFKLVPLFGARRVARELGLKREELLQRMNEEQEPAVASLPASPPGTSLPPAEEAPAKPIQFMALDLEWPGVASPPAAPTENPSTVAKPVARADAGVAPALAAPTDHRVLAADRAPAQSTPLADHTALAIPTAAAEAVVEVLAADGTQLTVRIPVTHLNLSALIHDFRSHA